MRDSFTNRPILVSTDDSGRRYIMVPPDQRQATEALLHKNSIPYDVEIDASRGDGRPAAACINLGFDADVASVQSVLDNIP